MLARLKSQVEICTKYKQRMACRNTISIVIVVNTTNFFLYTFLFNFEIIEQIQTETAISCFHFASILTERLSNRLIIRDDQKS